MTRLLGVHVLIEYRADGAQRTPRRLPALMQGGRASLWRLVPPTDMKAEEVDEATPKMLTRISKWQKG